MQRGGQRGHGGGRSDDRAELDVLLQFRELAEAGDQKAKALEVPLETPPVAAAAVRRLRKSLALVLIATVPR